MINNHAEKRETPYIPAGIFKIRLPFVHYRVEKVELIQGLIIGATALASIPYLIEYLGIDYELAWSMVIFEVALYLLHGLLGDPVVPGWITPSLPFTLAFISTFPMGTPRLHAVIAVQLLVGLIFIFLGATKIADKFINYVPNSIKGGILLAAPITVLKGQFVPGSQMMTATVATLVGAGLLALLSYSPFISRYRSKIKILDIMCKYGNLFPYLLAMLVGILLGELDKPVLELGTIIKIPDVHRVLTEVSVFAVGLPPLSTFIKAIPTAFICYILAFGDFVTSESLIDEAKAFRDDELVDFNAGRSNLVSGIRNTLLSLFAPFPPLAGPLWVGMTVSVAVRYREGKEAMQSLIGGMATFRIATLLSVIFVPVVSFMNPVMGVGAAIALLFQAYVCGQMGMEYSVTNTDKSIAGVVAATLAFSNAAVALLVGFLMNLMMSNMEFQKKKYATAKIDVDEGVH